MYPGSRQVAVIGEHAGALIVRIRERAIGGKATAAALTALAAALHVPASEVRLVSGATSRTKIVDIPDNASDRFTQLLQT